MSVWLDCLPVLFQSSLGKWRNRISYTSNAINSFTFRDQIVLGNGYSFICDVEYYELEYSCMNKSYYEITGSRSEINFRKCDMLANR